MIADFSISRLASSKRKAGGVLKVLYLIYRNSNNMIFLDYGGGLSAAENKGGTTR
ncbi:hypothetical protein DEV91_104183 [Phyllobacterium brassicacearum]|nr:hypothetical protein DEV91_104183 [Phyllobacterium brassicacearum]